jgi:catechol 2,3-dioxygenase-like lactoylglutathione lyase family enzyme
MRYRTVAPLEIGFCVVDLERSLAFWKDALGLREISRIHTPAQAALESGIAPAEYEVIRLERSSGERVKLLAGKAIQGKSK